MIGFGAFCNDDSMEDDWVINLSEWMANFTVSYFMKGGAKKSYIRDIRQRNQLQYKEYQTVYEALPNDLIPSHEIIKVLHIGSHHNHLQRSSFQQYIDVTTAGKSEAQHPMPAKWHGEVGRPTSLDGLLAYQHFWHPGQPDVFSFSLCNTAAISAISCSIRAIISR